MLSAQMARSEVVVHTVSFRALFGPEFGGFLGLIFLFAVQVLNAA